MKRLTFIFLFTFTCTNSFAQIFQVDSLPKQGLLFEKGWKWHSGDNSAWAAPEFDDSNWNPINVSQDIFKMDKLPQTGIGWLRLKIKFSQTIKEKLFTVRIGQSGASEVYLNGKLVMQNGIITKQNHIGKGVITSPLQTFSLDTNQVQAIAIRYAYSRNNFLNMPVSFLRFGVFPGSGEKIRGIIIRHSRQHLFLFSIFFILGTLQILLYRGHKSQLAYLYFGLFLLFQSLTHLSNISYEIININLSGEDPNLLQNISTVFFITGITFSAVFYLTGIYQYFKQPKKSLYYLILFITILAIPTYLFNTFNSYNTPIFLLGCLIPWLEIFRVGVINWYKKTRGARLFTISHAALLVCFILYTLAEFFPQISFLRENINPFFFISFLIIAIIISVLLSEERAETNKILQKQVVALEDLNHKILAQEHEKQQILSTQNELLERQVEARTAELKASQAQLIQKEKLASLGELTAGIAHEIQNPLNFVNNFAELSVELIEELKSPLTPDGGILDGQKMDMDLFDDVVQNLEKINHHGKRASSIVKGMLEHSRQSKGERELTNINQLADEYLRLAYHGMMAKDTNGSVPRFNADSELIADTNLPKINVVPQDIGRVLLNLINNAFYAVNQRRNLQGLQDLTGLTTYQPKVTVSTKASSNAIEIKVTDNGTGMSEETKAKIFRPFFTTKPTGEGTGLGLSLAYDIVTKGHGGTLEVETKEGEGTKFIVTLPP
jgi:signal transduction histidine kinase